MASQLCVRVGGWVGGCGWGEGEEARDWSAGGEGGGGVTSLCTRAFPSMIYGAALGWEHGRPTPAIATHRCKTYKCDSTFFGGEAKLAHGP